MKFIISGGTGFIGRRIVTRLLADTHYVAVWSRRPGNEKRTGVASHSWDPLTGEPPSESLNGMDTVIHLAGESVAQRWNADVRKRIRDSRIMGTRRLVDAIGRVQHPPKALVCASAIGYYGDRGTEILQENAAPGSGFLAELCQAWEEEAKRAEQFDLRVVSLRVGLVLGNNGGALQPMIPVFRSGLGGRLGSGRQFMSWIHVDDAAAMFCHAATNDVSGVWNCTSPNPATNAEFTTDLAKAVHRTAIFPVPAFALRLLFGEFGERMLDSARAVPKAALRNGFSFTYPQLPPALDTLLK